MKRKDGFLVIDDYEVIPFEKEMPGRYIHNGWLQKDNMEYLLKYYSLYDCYREVIFSRFADKMNILNVGYDLALFQNKTGVITKRYTNQNAIFLKDLIKKNHKEQKKNDDYIEYYKEFFHMEMIENLLKRQYEREKNYDSKRIHDDLFIKFISQILFANCDLCVSNLEVIEDTVSFFPLFDFGSCGVVNLNGWKGFINFYSLKRFLPTEREEHPKKTINSFLEQADKKEIEVFKKYLEEARSISLDSLFKEIEEETNAFIPKSVNFLKLKIRKNLENVQNVCKENRRF